MKSRGGKGYRVGKICCIHPEARSLTKRDSRFHICLRSVFEVTPGVDVLRTMNILNRDYFSADQLIHGARAVFQSIKPGGIWIAGRTLQEDLRNHVTFLKRQKERWEVIERIGGGSEIEEFAHRASHEIYGNEGPLMNSQGTGSPRIYTTIRTL
jgi:hypothetical protein